nr:MBL fold metallo-hydrolase [Deinobacterium chartae]
MPRTYPSAHSLALRGSRPILVDTGFGSDAAETERLLRAAGIEPATLMLVVHTHHHSDHVGGTAYLRARYGVPVAAHVLEAMRVNLRFPDACDAVWLDQPVEAYSVDLTLEEGAVIDAGSVQLEVLHTPGHTPGHISLWEPRERVLLLGDAAHSDDVAWLAVFGLYPQALEQACASLERLLNLGARLAYSGHGAPTDQPRAVLEAALARYARWYEDPQRLAWHACKRILAFALMIRDGIAREEIGPYLLACPWFRDHARMAFGMNPQDFVEPLLQEMLRSRAAEWRQDKLVALTPHRVPGAEWARGPTDPAAWEPL